MGVTSTAIESEGNEPDPEDAEDEEVDPDEYEEFGLAKKAESPFYPGESISTLKNLPTATTKRTPKKVIHKGFVPESEYYRL